MTDERDRRAIEDQVVATATTQAVTDARDHRRDRIIAVLVVATVLGLVYVGWQLYESRSRTASLQSQLEGLVGQEAAAEAGERQLATQVRQLGAQPVVQPPASTHPAPAATQDQVDGAVDGYLAAHPPVGATPAMIAVQVAQYLTAHPPAGGPPPTAAVIATAAGDYISAHAADFRGQTGQAGQDGHDGQNATDAQVASTVAAYCANHDACTGQAGPQGVSVTDVSFDRSTDGTCQAVIALHNPATGADSTITHPAGDAACPAPASPTTVPTTTPDGPLASLVGGH